MIQSLDLKIIAEGVETKDDLDFVQNLAWIKFKGIIMINHLHTELEINIYR